MTTELVVGAHTAVLIDRSDGRRPRTAGVIPLDGCTLDIVSYRRCIDAYVHDSAGRTMVILSADSIRAQTDITVTAIGAEVAWSRVPLCDGDSRTPEELCKIASEGAKTGRVA